MIPAINRMPTSLNSPGLKCNKPVPLVNFLQKLWVGEDSLNTQENSVFFYCLKEKLSYNI